MAHRRNGRFWAGVVGKLRNAAVEALGTAQLVMRPSWTLDKSVAVTRGASYAIWQMTLDHHLIGNVNASSFSRLLETCLLHKIR